MQESYRGQVDAIKAPMALRAHRLKAYIAPHASCLRSS